jgi:N-acetylmuramoyl-L-alanine amidase CwlA
MDIKQNLLTPNRWSRPQTKIGKVKGVVLHWTANPLSSALANRNFFENRKLGKTKFGSAHYIVGLQGEIIQCLPEDEIGYHVGSHVYTAHAIDRLGTYPNNCTLGIECTHIDWNGKMNKSTFDTTVELAVHLLKKYNLTENDLWLHKTVVGWKDCHKFFVDNNNEWQKFKTIVGEKLNGKAKLNPEVEVDKMVHVEQMNLVKTVIIDEKSGKQYEGFIVNGVTFAPVRQVSESNGKYVFWDGKNVILK